MSNLGVPAAPVGQIYLPTCGALRTPQFGRQIWPAGAARTPQTDEIKADFEIYTKPKKNGPPFSKWPDFSTTEIKRVSMVWMAARPTAHNPR